MKIWMWVLVLALLIPVSASAYLDPGNGSYVFQIILGVFFTALFSLRMAWSKVLDILRKFSRAGSGVESGKNQG
jgi:hypothetical protein